MHKAASFELKNPKSLRNILQLAVLIIQDQVDKFGKEPSVVGMNALKKVFKGTVERPLLAYSYGNDIVDD